MAKAIKWYIKLQIKWGQATPAPPVWPALGQHWVAIPEFTKRFNDETKDRMWLQLPVLITVYEDRTFDFVVKQPPAGFLIKTKLNLKAWSKVAQKDKVGHITFQQLKEIAEHDKRIKVISNVRNFGHIRSPYYGLLQCTGDAVIAMVADLQDPPEMIPKYIEEWEKGHALVLGIKTQSKENPLMFLVRKLFYSIIKKISNEE